MLSCTEEIKEAVRSLLKEGKVKYFLGFRRGTDGFSARPFIARVPEDADSLIWDPSCVSNLSTYLIDEWKRVPKRGEEPDERPVGIMVKGCDSRSIALLIQEHILTMDKVQIIGLPCRGVVDPKKMEEAWQTKGHAPGSAFEVQLCIEGDKVTAACGDAKEEFELEGVVMEKCKVCRYPNPVVSDELIGDEVTAKSDAYNDVVELEKLSLEERWQFWSETLSRCVRCYACRNVCPACYCKECSVARTDPTYGPRTSPLQKVCKPHWTEKTPTLADNLNFHLSRMYHLVGRCTNCGECERVCPVGIPLRLLTRKLEKDVSEIFDYESGTSTDPRNLLGEFADSDPGGFIR